MQKELTLDRPRPREAAADPFAPCSNRKRTGKAEHFVELYEQDTFLIESVSDFIGAALRQGESAIVIATKPHREALDRGLREAEVDLDQARKAGQYFAVDAAELLSKFMAGSMPDPQMFHRVVGGLVVQATAERRPLRAFGEMVALLWQEGKGEAAIRLEELWNDLVKEHSFSLFCAYPMGGFTGEPNGKPFSHICRAHTRVIPSESYQTDVASDEHSRGIAVLQQKANSLEVEVARRKHIEQELARRERELSDFLLNASEGIHQVAPDGTILWANKAELELLGYAAEEYIGHDIREFHADGEVIADVLERLGRGEKLQDYEARLKHKDGSIRHVSLNSSVYWEGDRFLYTRCFTRDITGRKRAAEILEQAVTERTAQLRESMAELEAFSYSISHDMRAPLRAMEGYANALMEDYGASLPPGAVRFLERIECGASRLDQLIRDILAYSKVANSQIELRPIALAPLLENIMEHPELEKFKACVSIEGPMPRVLGHEASLAQCLINLIENALKFVAPGTIPRVRIRAESPGDKVSVSIADNGIGIEPEHYGRIFQIFGRAHSGKNYPGTGIGLAVAKKAIARMGGQIGFDSEVGKGTTFWFILPEDDSP